MWNGIVVNYGIIVRSLQTLKFCLQILDIIFRSQDRDIMIESVVLKSVVMKQCKRFSFCIKYNGTHITIIPGVTIFVSNHFAEGKHKFKYVVGVWRVDFIRR